LRGAIKIKLKLVILDVLGGIFGWIWIGAAIASVYFLYGVLASAAPWSNLIWSLGVAFLAKCLSVSFNDHKQRVDYVDQLIRRGHTQTAATEAWRTALNGGLNTLLNMQQAEAIREIGSLPTEETKLLRVNAKEEVRNIWRTDTTIKEDDAASKSGQIEITQDEDRWGWIVIWIVGVAVGILAVSTAVGISL
jgi:hypothetical protein